MSDDACCAAAPLVTRAEIETINAMAIAMNGGITQSTKTHQFAGGEEHAVGAAPTIRFTTSE